MNNSESQDRHFSRRAIGFRKRAARLLGRVPHDLKDVGVWSWNYRLIADIGTDNQSIVGTAFPIGENILVTAKHIFVETWESKENTEVDRSLCAVQGLPGNKFVGHRINRMLAHKTSDLMLLYVCPGSSRHESTFWTPPWKISRTAPHKGEIVAEIGYVEGELRIASRNPDGGILELWDQFQWSFGVVKTVYNKFRDNVILPCPCFEVGAGFSPGMSGGPVIDKSGRLCGVVSTGIEGTASSFAVTLWPALSDLYSDSLRITSSGTLCWR